MPKKCDIGHTFLDNKSLGNSDKTDILDISGRSGKNIFAPRHYEGTKINQGFAGYYEGAKINQRFSGYYEGAKINQGFSV